MVGCETCTGLNSLDLQGNRSLALDTDFPFCELLSFAAQTSYYLIDKSNLAIMTILNRVSLSKQIKEALLERILSHELKPGDRLIELKIAEEMQTSQAPVREALRELEAIGLVENQRNRGARVRAIDQQELAEIYAVRAELEALAGELVARDAPETGKALKSCYQNLLKCAEKGNSKRFTELNSQFHRTIVENSGNRTLKDTWQSLHVLSRTWVNISRSSADLVPIAKSHLPIVEAITNGDTTAARAESWKHVKEHAPIPDDDMEAAI